MLDLKLRLAHRDRAVVERLRYLALLGGEQFAALVPKRADRDDGQARVDLDAGDGIARRRADERLLEILVGDRFGRRSEEHTSELQSLMRISYAVFCLKKKTNTQDNKSITQHT